MRILVHEFVSGGGLAGQDVPASLVREGSAMLTALLEDLAAIGGHEIVTTIDPRFALAAPEGVDTVMLGAGKARDAARLEALITAADAVWIIAPESDRCLERLAAAVERRGKMLIGCGSLAVRRASDKAALPRLLAAVGVRHPETAVCRRDADLGHAARSIGYPVVVKPARGAGCGGVGLARDGAALHRRVAAARRESGSGPLLLQRYVPGVAASVSLVADGTRAVPLALNAQSIRAAASFSYEGGATPLDHPLAAAAMDAARRTCEALPDVRGYVGVDLVLTETEAVVIEVNPRLTTGYLGVRAAIGGNIAAMAIAACGGALPARPRIRRSVRFSVGGRIERTAL
jgi:tyramine---L-glutamate ligase